MLSLDNPSSETMYVCISARGLPQATKRLHHKWAKLLALVYHSTLSAWPCADGHRVERWRHPPRALDASKAVILVIAHVASDISWLTARHVQRTGSAQLLIRVETSSIHENTKLDSLSFKWHANWKTALIWSWCMRSGFVSRLWDV